jgi:hypothetical protein
MLYAIANLLKSKSVAPAFPYEGRDTSVQLEFFLLLRSTFAIRNVGAAPLPCCDPASLLQALISCADGVVVNSIPA